MRSEASDVCFAREVSVAPRPLLSRKAAAALRETFEALPARSEDVHTGGGTSGTELALTSHR
eukprot:7795470-Alexandrium_andersonii.AAC.1